MRKIFLLIVLFTSVSTLSFSQSAGKGGSEKSGGFFYRLFHKEQQPRGQMRHFEKRKKDPNMKFNGTSWNRKRKSRNKVDGDGFGTADQGKMKRRKRR